LLLAVWMMERSFEFRYEGATACRLDLFLVNALAAEPELTEVTRSQIKQRIEGGSVLVEGRVILKAGHAIKPGNLVQVVLNLPPSGEIEPYDYPLKILFEDKEIVVVDKPAGLSMHPGAGNPNRSLLNALIGHFGGAAAEFEEQGRLGIVHRLDKDTSGVVVVAKTPMALAKLSAQFTDRSVLKAYLALVYTTPRGRRAVQITDHGRVDAPLGRHPGRRTLMAVVEHGGRPAVTDWRRLEELGHAALLEVTPRTGRTHQIRVHMNYIGSPILGDPVYGNYSGLPKPLFEACRAFGRQALHAARLEFNHPSSGVRLSFESPLPEAYKALLNLFRSWGKGLYERI